MLISNKIPGRTAVCGEKEYLFFSGTSYLGMNTNPEFLEYLSEGISVYGTNYSSSRNSNLRLKVFEDAERQIANYTGAGGALTLSSGYMAGQLTVRALENRGEFIYAPNVHPALWTKSNDFFNAEFGNWAQNSAGITRKSNSAEVFILANSLDPLMGRKYDFGWVSSLPKDKKVTLIIDDSHGFGIIGVNGSGIFGGINSEKEWIQTYFPLLFLVIKRVTCKVAYAGLKF